MAWDYFLDASAFEEGPFIVHAPTQDVAHQQALNQAFKEWVTLCFIGQAHPGVRFSFVLCFSSRYYSPLAEVNED
ncbi:hypothetical protein AA15669_1959 [Saccharibacter floricola DSM 15669]|uniref:Uncharacterized protein n=1 Tax=Saccharibacter floricola DSM 15669 TaxID=1123227 RepID=A0ABQ0P186_9PROT|nr:hypothetical protein AA15669_1959 [Saccharibacter floricola DSM 15669]